MRIFFENSYSMEIRVKVISNKGAKLLLLAVLWLSVSLSASASPFTFVGSDIFAEYYRVNTSGVIIPPTRPQGPRTVDLTGVPEFDQLGGDLVSDSDIEVDFTEQEIAFVFKIEPGVIAPSFTFASGADFNGFSFQDINGVLSAFLGFKILTNDLGISRGRISVTNDEILLDVQGLTFEDGDQLVLLVRAPNAHMLALFSLGLLVLVSKRFTAKGV